MKNEKNDNLYYVEHQHKVKGAEVKYRIMGFIPYIFHLVEHFVIEFLLSLLIKLENKTCIDFLLCDLKNIEHDNWKQIMDKH